MKLTREQAQSYTGGGSTFFKLQDGETAKVRFLYNTIDDIEPLGVHVVKQGNNFATIDCGRLPGDPMENCKWCSQDNKPVARVVIPMFNLDTNEISYWTRSQSWVEGTLIPTLEAIPKGQPISGQTYFIKRKGSAMQDTTYTPTADLSSQNDMKTKDMFGEVKDPFEMNIIKPHDFEFPAQQQGGYSNNNYGNNNYGNNNYGGQQGGYGNGYGNNNYGGNNYTSTRRTTDVF
jgi:hypothetical protein